MTSPIGPGQTQYLKYQNSFIKGVYRSADSVGVFWGSGFATSCKAKDWDERTFLENPQKARLLLGAETQEAEALFDRPAPQAPKPYRAKP